MDWPIQRRKLTTLKNVRGVCESWKAAWEHLILFLNNRVNRFESRKFKEIKFNLRKLKKMNFLIKPLKQWIS